MPESLPRARYRPENVRAARLPRSYLDCDGTRDVRPQLRRLRPSPHALAAATARYLQRLARTQPASARLSTTPGCLDGAWPDAQPEWAARLSARCGARARSLAYPCCQASTSLRKLNATGRPVCA